MVVTEAGAGSDQQGVAVRQTWSTPPHSLVLPISNIKLTSQCSYSGDQLAAGWYRKINRL